VQTKGRKTQNRRTCKKTGKAEGGTAGVFSAGKPSDHADFGEKFT